VAFRHQVLRHAVPHQSDADKADPFLHVASVVE
jgi:hypothetical protein